MDSGLAALLGALIGGVFTLLGSLLNDYLSDRRAEARDRPARELLRQMLSTNYDWRKLTTMANVIGATHDRTTRLLLEIGARGSESDGESWSLIKRNPLPAHYGPHAAIPAPPAPPEAT